MSVPSSRRDFLKMVSLAGAAVAAAGIPGCAKKEEVPETNASTSATSGTETDRPAIWIDEEGFAVVEDSTMIAVLDSVFRAQEEHVRRGRGARSGLRVKYTLPVDDGTDPSTRPVANHLCDCRPNR